MVTIERRPTGVPRPRSGAPTRAGFTLLEVLVVLVIGGILIGMAAAVFSGANARASARRAAQVFSRDLALARGMAVRGRETVVIRFDEAGLAYEVETASGRMLATRRFGPDEDVNLSAIDLTTTGDSLAFSNRGIAALAATLDTATFSAGENTSVVVTFNGMGASRVGEL